MEFVFIALAAFAGLLGLASLVFFVLVCVKMFQHEQTGLGITCLVLGFLCGGLGVPIAFVYGWIKAGEWNMKGLMMAWTGIGVLGIILIMCMGVSSMVLGTKASGTFTTVGQTIGR